MITYHRDPILCPHAPVSQPPLRLHQAFRRTQAVAAGAAVHRILSVQVNLRSLHARVCRAVHDLFLCRRGQAVRIRTGPYDCAFSIVKEILTLHKAKYGVTSKVGKGSTFWFEVDQVRLPRKRQAIRGLP